MKIDAVDIHQTIVTGLKNSWVNHFLMTDERNEDIKPEYLTTASVCYALTDFISNKSLSGIITVRAEQQTGLLWRKKFLPVFMKFKSWLGLKIESNRKGNVDISLAIKKASMLDSPFGVIENRGFLIFTEDNELYKNSMNEVKKDLVRNIEFVRCVNDHGIEYSGFTFYLRDKNSVLISQGDDFCRNKKLYFEKICKNLMPKTHTMNLEIEIGTLEANLFETDSEANALDENNCPIYLSEGTWHIIYGVISIFDSKIFLTNEKLFKT